MEMQTDMVRTIVSRYGATSVAASQFFISWNSVATLAYEGFSRTLLAIKRGIGEAIPGLQPENPGSLWPKTTLGCLHENKALSSEQVYCLRSICEEKSADMKRLSESDRCMEIKELSVVTFLCRTLEKRLAGQIIALEGRAAADDKPPKSHLSEVSTVMNQFAIGNHTTYYPNLAPKGRTINEYYRKPHIEATLVYDLKPSAALMDIMESFRQTVNEKLPEYYAWLDQTSWHMTIRALTA